jgi:hypothetical protein
MHRVFMFSLGALLTLALALPGCGDGGGNGPMEPRPREPQPFVLNSSPLDDTQFHSPTRRPAAEAEA